MVRIGADLTGLNKGLDQVTRDVQRVGKRLTKLGGTLTSNLTVPIVAVGAAFVAAAIHVGKFADVLLDLRDQTGLSTGTLQEFRHVALIAGVDSDTLATAAIKLTTAMSSGDEQTKDLSTALTKLGLSATDSAGKIVSMNTLLPSIIGKLQGVTDITTRNTLAADIFGRSWAELAPILSLGAGGMERARTEARSLGLVMSEEGLEGADKFRAALGTLTSSFAAIVREIGVGVIPVMESLVKVLQATVIPAVRGVVAWFTKLSPAVKITIGVIAGLAAAMGPLLVALGTVLAFLPLLKVGFLAAFTGPIGLAVLAIGTLIVAGTQLIVHWDFVKGQFILAWAAMRDAVIQTARAILLSAALKATPFPGLQTKILELRAELERFAEDALAKTGAALVALDLKAIPVITTLGVVEGAVTTITTKVDRMTAALQRMAAEAERAGFALRTNVFDASGDRTGVGASIQRAGFGKKAAPFTPGDPVMGLPPGFGRNNSLIAPQRPSGAAGAPGAGDSLGAKVGQVIQAGAGGGEIAQMVQAFASFGPMAVLLPIVNSALETLGPAFAKLLAPLVEIGRIIGELLAPVFEMLAPAVQLALTLFKTLAPVIRGIVIVMSFFWEVTGLIVRGIGKLIDSLPFVSAKGIINSGQAMIDAARAARKNTDATDDATTALEKFASALSNIPRVLNINALRHLLPGPVGTSGTGGGGGGAAPDETRRAVPRGSGSTAVYSGDIFITVPGAGDPVSVAEAVGRVLERARVRGGVSRLAVAVAT